MTSNHWPRWAQPEDFAAYWATVPPAAQSECLDACLTGLASLDILERGRWVLALHKITGHTIRDLKAAAQAARERASGWGELPTPPTMPVVDYIENATSMEVFFDAVLDAVLPAGRLYMYNRQPTWFELGREPVTITGDNWGGYFTSLAEIRFLREHKGDTLFKRFGPMPGDLAKAFLSSPSVAARLPEVRTVVKAPVYAPSWRWIGSPGYHPDDLIWYDGPKVVAIGPDEKIVHLPQLLRDVQWASPADQVNYLSMLLTVVTMPVWAGGHPGMVINGNQPRCGKSTLARLCALIGLGAQPGSMSWTWDDEEMGKQIGTRFKEEITMMLWDNIKSRRPLSSPVIERLITEPKPSVRELGHNRSLVRPTNDLLFLFTCNDTLLCTDMGRRVVPVNLFLTARHEHPGKWDVEGWALAHRRDLLAELASMVDAWIQAGRPAPTYECTHSTAPLWAQTMAGILEVNGFTGLLSNYADSTKAFDPRYQLVCELAAATVGEETRLIGQWIQRITAGGMSDALGLEGRNIKRTPKQQEQTINTLFRDFEDQILTTEVGPIMLVRSEVLTSHGTRHGWAFRSLS